MDKNQKINKKRFLNNSKKKQNAQKSVNNYLSQLKMHFELSDEDVLDILKGIIAQYKKSLISSKQWWNFFK